MEMGRRMGYSSGHVVEEVHASWGRDRRLRTHSHGSDHGGTFNTPFEPFDIGRLMILTRMSARIS
jgi:hypothetical protein